MTESEEVENPVEKSAFLTAPANSNYNLHVSSSGETSFQEDESPLLQLTRFMNQPEKGIGMITKEKITKSTICITNTSVATVVVGSKKMEVCHNCYQRIKKSAKYHAVYRYLPFCSYECLQCQEPFLDTCGPAILQIISDSSRIIAKSNTSTSSTVPYSASTTGGEEIGGMFGSMNANNSTMKQEAAIETQLLALTLLYNLSISTDIVEINNILSIFQLYDNLPPNKDDTKLLASTFYHNVILTLPEFIQKVSFYFTNFALPVIEKLFRIIRCNSQPMTCYGFKASVILLCLLPTIARINHSCIPNCTLVLELEEIPRTSHPVIHNVQSFVAHSEGVGGTPSSPAPGPALSSGPYPRSHLHTPTKPGQLSTNKRKVKISVLAMNDMIENEELSFSYLSNLCIPCTERRNLLSQGFHFHCVCEKCELESLSGNERWKHPSSQQLLTKMNTLQERLDNVFRDELSQASLPASNASLSSYIMHALTSNNESIWEVYDRMLRVAEDLIAVMKKLQSYESSYETSSSPLSTITLQGGGHIPPKTLAFAWSPSAAYDIALITIEDYQTKFRQLEGHWKDYITYGMIFIRAGMIIRDCWALAGSTTQIMRLDFMVSTCIHCTLMAKTYLDHERHSFPIEHLIFYVKQCLSFTVEANVIIDSVYLTNTVNREHESEVALEDLSAACDTWHYTRIIRDKAVRVRSYLKIMLDRLQQEKDGESSGRVSPVTASAGNNASSASSLRGAASSPITATSAGPKC